MSDFKYQAALDRAHTHSLDWIGSLGTRAITPRLITPRLGMAEIESRLGALPDGPSDAAAVVENSHERDRGAHRVAMSMHAPYLARFDDGGGNPYEYVPELSRRARGIPVWATLRALGRSGVADLVDL